MPDDTHRTIDRGVARLTQALKAFDPNQLRASDGKWTSSGSATSDTSNHTEDDTAFVAKYGDKFVPAMNYIWDQHEISANALSDLQDTINAKTPDELVGFIENNYLGALDDDEEVAKAWLEEQSFWATLPAAVKDNLDLYNVGSDLQGKDGPVISFYDSETELTQYFTLPKKG